MFVWFFVAAPTTTEVSLKLAQKAYIESRNRQWEDIKLKYNLKDADKSQHPMFALLTTGYLCEVGEKQKIMLML